MKNKASEVSESSRPLSGEPVLIHDGDMKVEVCCECGLAHFKVYRWRKIGVQHVMEMLCYKDDFETKLAKEAFEAVGK
jgi:hypothetical protein